LIEMHHRSAAAHLGSALSCVDILVALYWDALRLDPANPHDPQRDRFLLSKGHAASALYAVLAHRGFFDIEELKTFSLPDSRLPQQPAPATLPGMEAATGSLGHGLPIGVGLAKAATIQHESFRVFVLISDGECNEGSVWEAAMCAPAHQLSNLTVIIDYNRWQATGRSNDVMTLTPLPDKWRAFGWRVVEVNGHDIPQLQQAFNPPRDLQTQPLAIIAHTVKGKGVSFMEDDNNWHYRAPNEDEYAAAIRELAGNQTSML